MELENKQLGADQPVTIQGSGAGAVAAPAAVDEEHLASPMDNLHLDLHSQIISYLDIFSATKVSAVNKDLRDASKVETEWKQRFKKHFPYLAIEGKAGIDWKTEFRKACDEEYKWLTPAQRKVFMLFKESAVQSVQLEKLEWNDLRVISKRGCKLSTLIRENPKLLVEFYKEVVLKKYLNSFGKINPKKEYKYFNGYSLSDWTAELLGLDFAVHWRSTPLHVAVEGNHVEIVRILLAAGANVNTGSENDDEMPLHVAAKMNHLEILEVLIAAGANVNAVNSDGETPLFKAIINGHLEVVNALIAAGADVNKVPKDTHAPLNWALWNRNLEIVQALIAAGADVNKDCNNWAPLAIAVYSNRLDMLNALIAAGADVNRASKEGQTLLHEAAWRGNLDIVRVLIAAGANVNAVNSYGRIPLYLAVNNGRTEVAKYLAKLMLENYIRARDAETAPRYKRSISLFGTQFNCGYSKEWKVKAAQAVLRVVNNEAEAESLDEYRGALNNGELSSIARHLMSR